MKSFHYFTYLIVFVLAAVVLQPIGTYGFILKPTTIATSFNSAAKKQSTTKSTTTTSATTKLQAFNNLNVDFVAPEIWTSLLPTSLGFIKSEYGFSYAYGFGTALSAISVLRRFSTSTSLSSPPLLLAHTLAIAFYGFRLNLFLFIRTLLSQRQRDMIERIEQKSKDRETESGRNKFVSIRTPILLSTGLLYYALTAPTILIAKLLSASDVVLPVWSVPTLKILIGMIWFGFGIAALGDLTKTYVKQRQNDEHYLVTSGIFALCRHPNYVGEMIGWTANSLCGIVAASILFMQDSMKISTLSQWIGQGLGWVGIIFVLLRASTSLEKRQQESYGNDSKYQNWIKSSWKGWTLPDKKQDDGQEEHEIEFNDVEEDGLGSGI